MAYGNSVAYIGFGVQTDMDHDMFLNVGLIADNDAIYVASQDSIRKNATLVSKYNVPRDDGLLSDPSFLADFGQNMRVFKMLHKFVKICFTKRNHPTTLCYCSKEKTQVIRLNTKDIDIEDYKALFEVPSLNSEHDKGKDTLPNEEDCISADLDLTKKIEIAIRPNKQAMDALIDNLKKSYITYRLSPLIQLFLEKKERFDILITALQPGTLFCTQKENLPFLSRDGAYDYLIKKCWSEVFEKEIIPLNPISGHFSSINRCGITDVLLGPPNYHLYNDLIKEHYAQHLARDYSWEFFIQQIKNERDPELIKQWQKGMSEHIIFRLKSNPQICFDSLIVAQNYLKQHPFLMGDEVKPCNAFTLSYDRVEKIKDSFLREQIYQKIKDELRLPISLGCFCRTRFRHAGFHLYKKRNGFAHTSLLCAIKRKVRSGNVDELSDELARIADYIEKHPMVNLNACMSAFGLISTQPENSSVLKFRNDVITLIKSGYITQFENGDLYVSPKQNDPAQKTKKLKVVNA
ncbi:MAG: hypothetical protein ACSW8C_01310 [bacterium]